MVGQIRPRRATFAVFLVAGTGGAVMVRASLTQALGASTPAVGLVFAASLAALAGATGWVPGRLRRRDVVAGLAGGAVLVLLPVIFRAVRAQPIAPAPLHLTTGVVVWFAIVSLVAVSEEIVFRGALYDSLAVVTTVPVTICLTAFAFALLHVPFYGWGALPIDIAAGIWLGALRESTGSVTAPAAAHLVADWAVWFLR